MKKLLSFIAAATVAAGGLYAMAAPAGAASIPPSGVKGTGSAGIVGPLNQQQKLVHFECAAAATLVAASTSVDSCTLYADGEFIASAESISLSGQASATGALAAVDSWTSWLMVCWSVSTDPVLGDREYDDGCTTVNTPVLAA